MKSGFVFLVFVLLSLVHLFACYTHRNILRGITKPFLMLSLAAVYYFGAESLSVEIFIGLLCGFLGDTLLIFPGHRICFAGGLLSFAAGHVLYIIRFSEEISGVSPWIIAGIAIVYLAMIIFSSSRLYPHLEKNLRAPCTAYMTVIAVMSAMAVLRFFSAPCLSRGVIALGSVVFIVSDSILSSEIFKKETPHGHFYVMLTYLIAQASIAVGMSVLL